MLYPHLQSLASTGVLYLLSRKGDKLPLPKKGWGPDRAMINTGILQFSVLALGTV